MCWNVYRVENIVKQLWMIYYYLLHQRKSHIAKIRSLESFIKEWTYDFPKEVSIIKNTITVHGKHHIHKGWKSLCPTTEKQARSYTKITASYSSQGI